jgi:hypothetical protein
MALSNKHFDDMKKQMEHIFEQACVKMQEEKQADIMKLVGEDLYDYSDIYPQIDNSTRFRTEFMATFIDGEKLIIEGEFRRSTGESQEHKIVLLSNYSRISEYSYSTGPFHQQPSYNPNSIYGYNFWIPKDYIKILQICCNKDKYSSNGSTALFSLREAILHIKENLENGKYVKNNVDIHFMDVYQKQQELNKQKEELNIQKEELEKLYKDNKKDIKKEVCDLNKQKEQNRLVIAKIKMEQLKLVKDKEQFEKHVLENTNIDDFMNDNRE